jgi:2-phosphosulfolactate phosphatase
LGSLVNVFEQSGYEARFDWGLNGLRQLAPTCDVVVIVDVLSFSTAVDIATSREGIVFPFRWRDDSAKALAKEKEAILAVGRKEISTEFPYSLSPVSLQSLPKGCRIVLPSPNGATLTVEASTLCPQVICGCLRNAQVVAEAARKLGKTIAVIAAGELWNGQGSELRPGVEDLLGAGAILDALNLPSISPEGKAAVAAFHSARKDLERTLLDCSSGRELIEAGFSGDVLLAAHLDTSNTVPALIEGAFIGVAF